MRLAAWRVSLAVFLLLLTGCVTGPTPIDLEGPVELRYRVSPDDDIRAHMVIEGAVTTITGQGGREATTPFRYALEATQEISEENQTGIFTLIIAPIPETVDLTFDGQPPTSGEVPIPSVRLGMTRLGEIVEVEYILGDETYSLDDLPNSLPSLHSIFIALPQRSVDVGERWELTPFSSGPGTQGFAELRSFVEIEGSAAAEIFTAGQAAVTVPSELEEIYAEQGLTVDGTTTTELTIFFSLDHGWPMMSEGVTSMNVSLSLGEEVLQQVTYEFNISYLAEFR